MHDPHVGPVELRISGTSAVLLTKLAEQLGTDDAGAVFMRALGLLDMAVKARRDGKRLAFYDPESLEFSEVAF